MPSAYKFDIFSIYHLATKFGPKFVKVTVAKQRFYQHQKAELSVKSKQ